MTVRVDLVDCSCVMRAVRSGANKRMGKSKNRGTARAVRTKRCLGEGQEPATR